MKTGEKVVFEIYKEVLGQLIRPHMPSHQRTEAIKLALQFALEAGEAFAKLVEEKPDAKV